MVSVTVPRSMAIPQTLEGAGESEYLLLHMVEISK